MSDSSPAPRDFVIDSAGRYDWLELWPRVMQSRAALLSELLNVSDAQAAKRPDNGDGEEAWSILEVLQHALTYTRNVIEIIEGSARGEAIYKDPPGAIHDVEQVNLKDLLHATVKASIDLATISQRLPAEPNLEARVDHPRFGPFNSREWFIFLTVHDDGHRRQIAALKALP
jgi:uncharacterized damage-inducible protein DinB